jgi:hypothetical protein
MTDQPTDMDFCQPLPETGGGLVSGEQEGVRPFRLVKYFSLTASWSSWSSPGAQHRHLQQANKMLLKRAGLRPAAGRQPQPPGLPPVRGAGGRPYGRIRLADPVQKERLDTVVRNTIHSFHVQRVNIYDLEGTITYSTDPDLIGTTRPDLQAYRDALDGKSSSLLITTPGSGMAGFQRDRALRTFSPSGGTLHRRRGGIRAGGL